MRQQPQRHFAKEREAVVEKLLQDKEFMEGTHRPERAGASQNSVGLQSGPAPPVHGGAANDAA